MFILKKRIMKTFAKEPPIKFENLHPRPDYGKKDKDNKNGGVSFAGFMASIGGFVYIILDGFI
jgi:hypothetical protein